VTDDTPRLATGPLRTVLEQIGARNLGELVERPIEDILAALDNITIPPSEALLGALVLAAVHDMRDATEQMRDATDLEFPRFGGQGLIRRHGSLVSWE
jgi:hypothetical protein